MKGVLFSNGRHTKGAPFVNGRYTKGVFFCQKWYIKGYGVGPRGESSHINLFSVPSGGGGGGEAISKKLFSE